MMAFVVLSSQGGNANSNTPDYDAAYSIKGMLPFTAPENGLVLFKGSADWAAGAHACGILVNNKYIVGVGGHGGNNGTGYSASTTWVGKGDTITTYLGSYNGDFDRSGYRSDTLQQLVFVPFK